MVVPEGVTYISLLNNDPETIRKIESIVMPDSVVDIGQYDNNPVLKSVKLSKGVKKLGDKYFGPFVGCTALEEVVIPEGVETIGEECFMDCTSLKNVSLPTTLKNINEKAFAGCISLTAIEIPEGVKVAADAFLNSGMAKDSYSDGITYNGNFPVSYDKKVHDFKFRTGTTELPERFFGYDGSQNLHDEKHFDSVFIPDTMTKLDAQDLSNFSEITVDKNNPVYCSEEGVLFSKDKKILLRFPVFKECGEYVIPDTVEVIKTRAFEWCSRINRVVIPEGVKVIEKEAFALTNSLSEIMIPYTVTEIGLAAFVTEPHCDKNERRKVILIFYKDDIIIPMQLKRNWEVFDNEQKFSSFIRGEYGREYDYEEIKDADYKHAAAKILYFIDSKKRKVETYIKNHASAIMIEAIEAGSTGIVKTLIEDGLVDSSKKETYIRKANEMGYYEIAKLIEKT